MGLPREKALIVAVLAPVLLALGVGALLAANPGLSLEAFGYPGCVVLAATGKPCPLCGSTEAFVYALRGDPAAAWRANPFALLFIASLVLTAVGLTIALAWPRSLRGLLRSRALLITASAWGAILLLALVFNWIGRLL